MSAISVELSIIMPCLNEAKTLPICIGWAQEFLARNQINGEVVIGDNGSTDGSQEIARSLGARVVPVPVRGYGAACIWAARASYGKYVIMGDSDASYDFLNMEGFISELRKGADLVMGNRFLGGISEGAMPWKNRYFGNPFLSKLAKFFFKVPIGDIQCGLRGFSKGAFERMNLVVNSFEFASEMVIKATLKKMNIVEVPTTLKPDGRGRAPHLLPIQDGWRNLRLMILLSPRWLFLWPGLLISILSLVVGVRILDSSLYVGSVGFDVNTLVFLLGFYLVGLQATIFGLLAEAFGVTRKFFEPRGFLGKLVTTVSLEKILVFVGVLLVVGAVLAVENLLSWSRHSYGNLDPFVSLRQSVPSLAILLTAISIFFSAFFLSIIRMPLNDGYEINERV